MFKYGEGLQVSVFVQYYILDEDVIFKDTFIHYSRSFQTNLFFSLYTLYLHSDPICTVHESNPTYYCIPVRVLCQEILLCRKANHVFINVLLFLGN